jgi:hypothetical protein
MFSCPMDTGTMSSRLAQTVLRPLCPRMSPPLAPSLLVKQYHLLKLEGETTPRPMHLPLPRPPPIRAVAVTVEAGAIAEVTTAVRPPTPDHTPPTLRPTDPITRQLTHLHLPLPRLTTVTATPGRTLLILVPIGRTTPRPTVHPRQLRPLMDLMFNDL